MGATIGRNRELEAVEERLPRPWVGRRQQVVPGQSTGAAACSSHIGPAVRNTGSMFTGAGTNGVDKSFSSGSCGETGVMATSEMRFRNASAPDSGRHSEEFRLDAR